MPHKYKDLEGWFDFDDIYDLAIRRNQKDDSVVMVEIGAYLGCSTCYMAEALVEEQVNAQLHVVDTFQGDSNIGKKTFYEQFHSNMQNCGVLPRITEVHPIDSIACAKKFKDSSVDFAFIDAEHTYNAASKDLKAWWPKIKQGGLIAGHDYTEHHPGVIKAVDEFVSANGLQHCFRTSRSSWMLYKSHDIDAMYCINLPERKDRRKHAEAQFDNAGLQVNFFDAIKGDSLSDVHKNLGLSLGQLGCTASHRALHHLAIEQGHENILVFEDDVILEQGFLHKLKTSFSRCPSEFDIFYPGALCLADWGCRLFPFDDVVSRVGRVLGTHSYIVHTGRQIIHDKIMQQGDLPIDNWLAEHIHPRNNSFVSVPYLTTQMESYSDVAGATNNNGLYTHYVY